MTAVPLREIVACLDDYLGVDRTPDYAGALNGLQVEGPGPVRRVAAAVDASEAAVREAAAWGAELLLVHHGIFWDGLRPLTGPRFRKVEALIKGGVALYSVHLPLDAHPEVGNSALLARALGLTELAPFGEYKGTAVGWMGTIGASAAPAGPEPPGEPDGPTPDEPPGDLDDGPTPTPGVLAEELAAKMEAVLDGPVRVLPGGPERIARVAVVTGAGASMLGEAAASGLDGLVTGEAQHHHAIEAAELGVSVFLGGHYATETWGVKAVAAKLQEEFGVETMFTELPTGL